MMFSTLLGTTIGILLGLIPGIHPNNIAPLLIALPFATGRITALTASAAASFTVSSHIPSILIGAPSGENLSVLPGHKLTKIGKGITAIDLTLKGSLIAILLTPLIAIAYKVFSEELYPAMSGLIPPFLLIITFSMIKDKKSASIVLLSSLLGFLSLEGITIMPMLTGLFGTSTLIISLTRKNELSSQKLKSDPKTDHWKTTRSSTLSTVLSCVLGVLPAISSAITAVIGKKFGKMNEEEYLAFIGASNTTYTVVSFLALIYLGRSRSGPVVALSKIKYPENTLLIITSIVVSVSITYIVLKKSLPKIAKFMNRIDIRKATMLSLALLIFLNIYLTNKKGLIVLITSTAIGISTVKLKVPRINTMACLTIPTALLLI